MLVTFEFFIGCYCFFKCSCCGQMYFMSSTQHKYFAQTFTFLHNAALTEQRDSSFTQYKTFECNCHGLSCQSTSASVESLQKLALKGNYPHSINTQQVIKTGQIQSWTTSVDFFGPHFRRAPTAEDIWMSSPSKTLGFPGGRSENTSRWQLKTSRRQKACTISKVTVKLIKKSSTITDDNMRSEYIHDLLSLWYSRYSKT